MMNLFYKLSIWILLALGLTKQQTSDSNCSEHSFISSSKHKSNFKDNINHSQKLQTEYSGLRPTKSHIVNHDIISTVKQNLLSAQKVTSELLNKEHDGAHHAHERTVNTKLQKADPEMLQQNSLGRRELEQTNLESNQLKVESNIFEEHTIHQLHDAVTAVNRVLTICSWVSREMGDYSKGLTDLMTFRIEAIKETFLKFPTVLRLLNVDESTKDLFSVDKYIKTSLSLTTDEALSEQAQAMHQLVDNDSAKLDVRYALALMTKAISGTTRRIVERTSALEKATSSKNELLPDTLRYLRL